MPEVSQPTAHPPSLVLLLTLNEVSWVGGRGDDVEDSAAILILLVDAAFPLGLVVH